MLFVRPIDSEQICIAAATGRSTATAASRSARSTRVVEDIAAVFVSVLFVYDLGFNTLMTQYASSVMRATAVKGVCA
jgi:hypothetical protein